MLQADSHFSRQVRVGVKLLQNPTEILLGLAVAIIAFAAAYLATAVLVDILYAYIDPRIRFT